MAHFRSGDDELRQLLIKQQIVMHPFIIGELALGSIRRRTETLPLLHRLPHLQAAHFGDVLKLIELRRLYSRGIGLTDAHLLASILIQPGSRLWTRDKCLLTIAKELKIAANLP